MNVGKVRQNLGKESREKEKVSTSTLRKRDPITPGAMCLKVTFESGIFFRGPWPSFHISFITTRCSSHRHQPNQSKSNPNKQKQTPDMKNREKNRGFLKSEVATNTIRFYREMEEKTEKQQRKKETSAPIMGVVESREYWQDRERGMGLVWKWGL